MSKQTILQAFRDLPPRERVAVYDQLKPVINADADYLSSNRDPGTLHWDAVITPEPAPVSNAGSITEKNAQPE